jgi:uncharacterized protein (TIGR02246 family)
MKRLNVAVAAVVAACVLFVAACSGGDPKADEDAINAINRSWQELIVAKDAKAIANLYAEDGELMPPNVPKAVGREAIEQGWAGFLGLPGMTLTFETEKLVVAKSGDVAVDINNYKFSVGEGAAATAEVGKSVVTWVKRDGKWYVLTDMFSSNAAPVEPAPAADAASTVPEGAPTPETAPEAATGPAPDATAPDATPAPATPN